MKKDKFPNPVAQEVVAQRNSKKQQISDLLDDYFVDIPHGQYDLLSLYTSISDWNETEDNINMYQIVSKLEDMNKEIYLDEITGLEVVII